MPRRKSIETKRPIECYRHTGQERLNNPPVGLVTPETDRDAGKKTYGYDPHIDPTLQFDCQRSRIERIIDDGLSAGSLDEAKEALNRLKELQAPYLNWAGKAENTSFEVPTVSLHVHERIDPRTIIQAVRKLPSAAVRGARGESPYQVEVLGFDYYNTKTGNIESGGADKIALWLLDSDYDGRSLFPRQVFFPMAGEDEGWAKLARNLKAGIDSDLIEAYRGTVSLPFEAGEHRRIAVKIVDDRGIESLKVVRLGA